MNRIALSMVLACSLVPAAALADAVEPPPDPCPPGSEGRSSHAGPLCAPTPDCTDDSTCAANEHCTEISQCIDTRPCGGGWTPPDCMVEHVMDACDPTTTCGGTATCRTRHVCLSPNGMPPAHDPGPEATPPAAEPAPAAAPPAESSGGGCSASRGRGPLGAIALLSFLALAVATRARR